MADDTSSILPHERPLPPRTDLWTAAVFLLLGVAIVVLAWRMPTFKEQKGEIYTAPGLVPGLYGLVILHAQRLAGRALPSAAARLPAAAPAREAAPEGTSNLRLALAAALVPRLLRRADRAHAVLAGGGHLRHRLHRAVRMAARRAWRHARLTKLGTALLQGVVTGIAVVLVFESVFYVRLP